MVYLHNICKWEAGSRGDTYFKIENGDQPIPLIIDRKYICLNTCYMIRMCNKVKTKASILQQYLLCLVVYQKNLVNVPLAYVLLHVHQAYQSAHYPSAIKREKQVFAVLN